MRHSAAIFEASKSTDWRWFLGPLTTKAAVEKRIAAGVKSEKRDEAYAFAVRLANGGRVVGSTSFMTVVSKHKRAEIGSTWYSKDVWGTAVNPECKYLLLKHAFEDWGAVRVQLVTDVNNIHSQGAISKLGAKLEGTMRGHGIRPDGSTRDAMLYSIVPDEWPSLKSNLLSRLNEFRPSK
jgi:RimJ/RimL family protein N-acetyltransferase